MAGEVNRVEPNIRKSVAESYCRRYEISSLYHLTHWENLESMLRLGLLCRNLAKSQSISHKGFAYATALKLRAGRAIGGQSAEDYVPLFFYHLPPMLRVLQHKFLPQEIVYVCIGSEILGQDGVCFTDKNLAATGSNVFFDLRNLSNLQWEIIKSTIRARTRTEASHIQGAEVLVPKRIDPSYFSKIIVYNEATKTTLENTLQKTYSIPIEAKSEFYF